MPNSKRRTKQVKAVLFGDISQANALDWFITIYLLAIMSYLVVNLGGARAETMRVFVMMVGGLVGLHTLGWCVSKPANRVIDCKALIFIPFLCYGALHSMLLSPVPWLARGEWLLMGQAFLIFWVTVHNIRLRSQVWLLLLGLVTLAFATVLYAYHQYFHAPEALPMGLTQSPQYAGRASSMFGAPTQFAGLMLLVIFPMLACTFVPRLKAPLRLLCGYMAALFIIALHLTYSRGAFIACLSTCLIIPLFAARTYKGKYGWIACIVILGTGAAAAAYHGSPMLRERIGTMLNQNGEWSRFVMWETAWKIFKDHPLWGAGLGSFRFLYDQYCPSRGDLAPHYPHNEYLGTLAELGLVGFFLMLVPAVWIIGQVLRTWLAIRDKTAKQNNKRLRRVPSIKLFITCFILGLSAFAIHCFFEFHLKLPALLFWAGIYLAILCKCYPSQLISLPRKPWITVIVVLCGGLLAIGLPLTSMPYYQACAYAFEGERRTFEYSNNFSNHYTNMGFIDDTIRTLEAAVALEPQHAEAWSWLSAMHAQRPRFTPNDTFHIGNEAIVAAENALAIYPIDEMFWINYAHAVLLHGNRSQAEDALKRAIAYAPKDSGPWYAYALFLSDEPTRRDEALAAVEHALAINPHRADAKQLKRKILIP